MLIKIIEQQDLKMLETFCAECAKLNYNNNSSFENMKLDWCKNIGEYFCAVKDDRIIAVGGCHKFYQMERWFDNPWRILFRGCELPGEDAFKGISKADWNSITQREMIPVMIDYCQSDNLFLTTNLEKDNSNGKAYRNHRIMSLLAKQGILDHFDDMHIFDDLQAVWKLNIAEYSRRRNLLGGKYV